MDYSDHPPDTCNQESILWSAVVWQALYDAFKPLNGHGGATAGLDQIHAREWLTDGGLDFRTACWWAGIEPDIIISKAQGWAAAGWPEETWGYLRQITAYYGRSQRRNGAPYRGLSSVG